MFFMGMTLNIFPSSSQPDPNGTLPEAALIQVAVNLLRLLTERTAVLFSFLTAAVVSWVYCCVTPITERNQLPNELQVTSYFSAYSELIDI